MNNSGWLFGMAALAGLFACSPAMAGFFEGKIEASFQNPVLVGSTLGPGQFFDNTSTAVYSTFGGENGSQVFQWGSNAASGPGYSSLIFSPNQNVSISDGQTFDFGKMSFFNGTSELNSLVFGVNLVLSFVPTGSSLSVDTLIIPIAIGTTFNGGDAASNADFVTFAGLPQSFFVYEGVGGTAIVNGSIVGDPQFFPEGLTIDPTLTIFLGPTDHPTPYDPNQYLATDQSGPNGFPGGFLGVAPSAVPEPSSMALLGLGGIGLIVTARRRTGVAKN